MNGPSPSSILRPVLRLFGFIFIFGIPLFNRIWPSGWAWGEVRVGDRWFANRSSSRSCFAEEAHTRLIPDQESRA